MFSHFRRSPISEVELDFLRKVIKRVPKLFFILNKVDYLSAEEKESAVQFFRKVLHEQAAIDGDPRCSVSRPEWG
jgi:hypothetical protein